MFNKYVIVDLETTGNSPNKGDKIIQFAAVVIEKGEIQEQYSTLINPNQSIPPFITELTGISDEMVRNAPIFSMIAPKVLQLLEDAYFVAHNVLFDLSFLQAELKQAGYEGFYGPVLDTVEMARILLPTASSYQLSELALREGIHHERPHQADSDAFVTAQLFNLFIDRLNNLPMITMKQLYELSGGLKSDIALLLDDLLEQRSKTVETINDSITHLFGLALKKERFEQEKEQSNELPSYPINDDEKEKLLRKMYDPYEKREGQLKMMDIVFHSFSENKHAFIEAGTGIGKTVAYLLPSVFFAKETGETVVISTHTILLQEQLFEKEIPKLQKLLPFPVKIALLKGKGHYLCLRKFLQVLWDNEDNYDVILTKMQILVWLTETDTGCIEELNLSSGGLAFWDKIKNDDTYFTYNETWEQYEFYSRALKKAKEADIVITNHSLLLLDMNVGGILPPFEYCVIDEGHHFEQTAGKHFRKTLDYLSVRKLLHQFGYIDQKKYNYKLNQFMKEFVGESYSFQGDSLYTELLLEMDEFFKAIYIYATKKKKQMDTHFLSCRLLPNDSSFEWSALVGSGERFSFSLKELVSTIKSALKRLTNEERAYTNSQKQLIEEVLKFCDNVTDIRQKIREMIFGANNEMVTWVEIDLRSVQNRTTVYSQLISPADSLQKDFFTKKKGVVLTSGTLTVKNSFHYIGEQLGFMEKECLYEQIPSPFNYKEQVKMIVPNDLPNVQSVPQDEYVSAISEHIISIAEATNGRMLILFTSHEMLKKTYDLIRESNLLKDYVLIAQGLTSGSKSRLIRHFQRFDKAILLGTNSFWEGIDIPGEDLSCLIMVRLPFSSPNEPFVEAKSLSIIQKGGNPFIDYSLPEAILRFKQGFGRLIRSKTDRGYIIVFDQRLTQANYGKDFIQSIPPVPIYELNIHEMVELLKKPC